MKNHFQHDSDVPLAEVIQHPNPELTVYGYKKFDKAECILVPIISLEDTTKVCTQYYYCTVCKGNWKKISGTIGNINHHLQSKHPNLNQLQADIQLSHADQVKFAKRFVLLNGLPFSMIEDENFSKLCPGVGTRKALSEKCTSVAIQLRSVIKNKLHSANHIWVTFDEWSDSATQEYLGVHFFGLFINRVDHYCGALQPLVRTNLDADYLCIVLSDIFEEYGITNKIKGFVTDSAPVMKATAERFGDDIKWIPCFCHIMNNIMGKFITASEGKLSHLFLIQRSLGSSSLFHNYVIDARMKVSSLPSYTYTRWYSMYKLLRNTLILKEQIKDFIPEHNRRHSANPIELPGDDFFHELEMLINVIATARNAMMTLESDKFGTISKVIDCFTMLKTTVDSLDDAIWEDEKSVFYESYVDLYETVYDTNKDILLIASRLNPFVMSGTSIPLEDQRHADNLISEKLAERRQANTQPQAVIRPRQQFGVSLEVFSASQARPVNSNELVQYLTLIPNGVHDGDVFHFWIEKANLFPNLASIAREYLVIPATSGASERDFSKAKRTASVRRLAMKRNKVSDAVIIAANPELASSYIS